MDEILFEEYNFKAICRSTGKLSKIAKNLSSFKFTESSFESFIPDVEKTNHRHCSLHQKMIVLDHVLRRLEVCCNLICHCAFIMNVVSHFKLPN